MPNFLGLRVAAARLVLLAVSFLASLAVAQPPADDAARLSRLAAIARDLQDPETDAVALFTEAARAVGFVIWDEDRKVLAEPTGAPRLFLALTDAEIRAYARMFRSRHTVAREDLLAGIDSLYGYVGLPGAASPHALAWLGGAPTANASVRALTVFLQDLGALRRRDAQAPGSTDFMAELDPLQALLIVRVLSEEIGTPLRRAIARGEVDAEPKDGDRREVRRGPFAADGQVAEAPGWAEDAFVGGITGLFGEVVQRLGELGKKVSDGTGKANALASIAKFIATYAFLKGEVRVDAPGQPLVRTKTRDAGEQRTLVAKFWIDGLIVTDWLKENRKLVALAGLDVDMPKSGALKGVETEWQIGQSQFTTKTHLIQTVRGQPDISKVKTDDNGEARIRVEGVPQPRKLDPNKVMALDKRVTITVTPQVKSTEIQQDLVDAVTGAIGIKGGPSGWLTPVIECLYRIKWKGKEVLDLQVRDWQLAETIGQAKIEITASAHEFRRDHGWSIRLQRVLELKDVQMEATAFEPPPGLDPEMLKHLPPQYREQMEAGLKAAAQLARTPMFHATGPGNVELHVHDSETWYGQVGECDPENGEGSTTRNGDVSGVFGELPVPAFAQFVVQVDLDKNTAKLTLMGNLETDVVRTQRLSRSGNKTEQSKEPCGIFQGLELQPPFDKGIVIPLQITPIRDNTMNNYYGVVRVPFTYGKRLSGTALVSYSVTRKVKPK